MRLRRRILCADQIGSKMFKVIGELGFHLCFQSIAVQSRTQPRTGVEKESGTPEVAISSHLSLNVQERKIARLS